MHPWLQTKIFSSIEALTTSSVWPLDYQEIVFTNGCFDLLHPGHISYLMQSRDLGEMLVVGLNNDDTVALLKGSHRPRLPWIDRAMMLAALACVDLVIGFDQETPINLIYTLQPMVATKGGDYTPQQMIGKEYIESYGGRVEVLPYLKGYSSTQLGKE